MNKLMQFIVGKYGKSILRTLLAVVSGFLLKIGIPDAIVIPFMQHLEPITTALVLWAFTQIWSMADKKKNQ